MRPSKITRLITNVALFTAGFLTGIAAVTFYQIFGKPVMIMDPETDMQFDKTQPIEIEQDEPTTKSLEDWASYVR